MDGVRKKQKCQNSVSGVTYPRPCSISTINNTHSTERAHCSDVKFEPEGQPTFPGNGDGGIRIRAIESEVGRLLESTPHFRHYVSRLQAMH